MPDGKNMIDMRSFGAGSVEVTLRIPIQKGRYIEYVREYRKTDDEVFEANNEGKVIERKFGLGIIPPVDFSETSAKPYHRIAFFSKSKNSKLYFAGDKDFKEKHHSVRSEAGITCSIESYVVEESFMLITKQTKISSMHSWMHLYQILLEVMTIMHSLSELCLLSQQKLIIEQRTIAWQTVISHSDMKKPAVLSTTGLCLI